MSYKALTLADLEISIFNARKDPRALSHDSIEAMAKSLDAHGQIMPLVVHPLKGRKGKYGVFAGQRRYLGFKRNAELGKWAPDGPIDCMVREGETEAELIALSTAENIVRRDLYAYETYAALARSRRRGCSIDEIAGIVGQDSDWVKRAVRLGLLAEPIFKAYAEEALTLECAKAFAATEDEKLQLVAFDEFRKLPRHNQVPATARALLKVGDAELTRLLNFVGETAYRHAGGGYELDLFAEADEHRGLVKHEGLLRELAAAKQEAIRVRIRARASRDLRFAPEPPRNDFNMIDKSLAIVPPEGPLDPADEARLAALQLEQKDLLERSWQFRDASTGLTLPGAEAAIAEIDKSFDPNEAEIEAIETKRPIRLPDGEIFATIEIDDTGEYEVRYWWKDHKAIAAAEKPAAKSPAKAAPKAQPGVHQPSNAYSADEKPIADGAAIIRSNQNDWNARERADRRLKATFGLTADGVQSLRTIRRSMLRAQLLEDLQEGGTVARDYFVFGQLRMLLTSARSETIGMRRIVPLDSVDLREDRTGSDLLDQVTMRAFETQLETIAALPCFTEPDLLTAFEAYRRMRDDDKDDAIAMLACLVLERSLDADGYRVPLHDAIAAESGVAGAAELRSFGAFTPTAPFFNLFGKDQRLELAIPYVGRDTVASWAKRSTADQCENVAKVFLGHSLDTLEGMDAGAEAWVHDLLRFTAPASIAAGRIQEAAE